MAEAPDKDQQTEAPTAKRKTDAAKDGDILTSKEMATAFAVALGAGWLMFAGSHFFHASKQLLRAGLALDLSDPGRFQPMEALTAPLIGIALPLAGLLLLSLIAALATPLLLGSFGIRGKAMAFKGSRINPLAGLKRMFGLQGVTELAKAIAKVAALGLVGYGVLVHQIESLPALAAADPNAAAGKLGQAIAATIGLLCLALFLIAAIDIPAQWASRQKRLRMSKQQVKDEMRQSDGAPELKQAVRARQQHIALHSARKGMAEATVVLTNPTHFAVALRYRPGVDRAPVVVARGRGEIALAIRSMAQKNSVPTLDYPQLTRAIYFTTQIGRPVSEDLYIAVAAILAFVFRLDSQLARNATPPTVDVPAGKCFDSEGRRAT